MTGQVRLAQGKALGMLGEVPAFVVNGCGRGKAFYLNLPMSRYLQLRASGKETESRERLRGVLKWAGARQVVAVTAPNGDPISKLNVFRYLAGSNVLVGCLLESDKNLSAKIAFPQSGHLYDARAGKYLGEGKSFDITLPANDALILSLLPFRVASVDVAGGRAKPGEAFTMRMEIKPSAKSGVHAFRLEAAGPNGKPIEALAQNLLAKDGRATAEVPFALNDAPGAYRVSVRDVLTGARGEATVQLAP